MLQIRLKFYYFLISFLLEVSDHNENKNNRISILWTLLAPVTERRGN